jgi:uncharacterized protein
VWEPGKPSQNENEYFARRDAEWLKERRALLDAERRTRPSGPALQCPRCHAALDERVYHSMRLDVCPKCHGLWLDAGELEMVLHMPPGELVAAVNAVDPERLR